MKSVPKYIPRSYTPIKLVPIANFETDVSSTSTFGSEQVNAMDHEMPPNITEATMNLEENISSGIEQIECEPVEGAFTQSQSSVASSVILPVETQRNEYVWAILFGAFAVNFILEGLQFSIRVLIPPFKVAFNSSKTETTLVAGAFLGTPHLGAPIASVLINAYGCQRMTIMGSLLAAMGAAVSSQCYALSVSFLNFGVIAGFGLSLVDVATNTTLAQHFIEKLSLVSGIAVCGGGIGMLILMPAMEYLLEKHGWRHTNIVNAGIYLTMLFFGLTFRPPPQKITVPEDALTISLNSIKSETTVHAAAPSRKENCLQLSWKFSKRIFHLTMAPFQYKGFTLFAISNFIFYVFHNLSFVYSPNNLPKPSWLISLMGIFNTIGQIFFGWLGDFERVNCEMVYAMLITLCGVSIIIMPTMQSFVSLSVAAGFFGFFVSSNCALTNIILKRQIISSLDANERERVSIPRRVFEEKFTNAFGMLSFIQGVGNVIGPPLAGWLFEVYQSFDIAFYVGGLCIILSGLIMLNLSINGYLHNTRENPAAISTNNDQNIDEILENTV